MQNIYERYAEIKRTKKILEEEEKELAKEIIEKIDDKERFTFGTFTKATKRSYKYSDKVNSLKEEVKMAEIDEREQGIAKVVESHYLLFTMPKPKHIEPDWEEERMQELASDHSDEL